MAAVCVCLTIFVATVEPAEVLEFWPKETVVVGVWFPRPVTGMLPVTAVSMGAVIAEGDFNTEEICFCG